MATQLTPAQAKIVTRKVEFSISEGIVPTLIKAFPSVTFVKNGSNGGVTYMYTLTGPTVWLDRIERKYAYGAGFPTPKWL